MTNDGDSTEHVSKTARKRDALRVQALGEKLTHLTPALLADVPASDALKQAVDDYRRFSRKEARRRQLQFIGRLMRDEDVTAIQAAVDAIEHESADHKFRHRQIETWRERLLADRAALTAYLDTYPRTDVPALRHLLAECERAAARDPETLRRAARKLYRFLAANAEQD